MKILIACNDSGISNRAKNAIILKIMFPDWKNIPKEKVPEALKKACEFIDCGVTDDGTSKPKLIDWEQDASVIIPEVNKIANMEIRANPDIHWWTFWGWFMGIGGGLFASILHIRTKKAKGKKLEKWEHDFYQENKSMIDFKTTDSEEVRAEKDSILKYL